MLLILMGALLFLDNVGLLPIRDINAFWPVWMIIWGVFIIDRGRHMLAWIWAFALIVCGVLLILGNLRILPVNASIIWPVMLIALGVALLVAPGQLRQLPERWRADSEARRAEFARKREERRERFRERWGYVKSYHGSTLHEDVVFSAVNRRLETQQFEGGRLAAVFGSVQVDLVNAGITPPGGVARLKADAVFGGIEVIVPRTWKVDMKSAAVFGGCDDRTVPPRPELGVQTPTLVVTGAAVFGGITIRN
jgi:hypothetical protein